MATYVGETKERLSQMTTRELKDAVQKDAWISLRQYFCEAGNGPEARIACVVIATLAREKATENAARQITLMEKRYQVEAGRVPAKTSEQAERPQIQVQ